MYFPNMVFARGSYEVMRISMFLFGAGSLVLSSDNSDMNKSIPFFFSDNRDGVYLDRMSLFYSVSCCLYIIVNSLSSLRLDGIRMGYIPKFSVLVGSGRG
ncbi:hypothetical protein F4781DRAFT_91956 [Annulohypoxylon bovei var. microspora]|nr:hypothetical protein F4781DRAFT_91956 [Annulohypoxylon bovei var. microspora]